MGTVQTSQVQLSTALQTDSHLEQRLRLRLALEECRLMLKSLLQSA